MIRHALIADDDDLSREYLAEALRASGIEVSEAVDGRDAQRLFDADRHDLVFSDLRMPGGNGIEVLQAVKTASPRTPVVLVTAYGSVECAVQAMRD
ncbi:MAG: response regulator, partial [Salinibacterium sp.]|nr:response regulator [Salinibacterium sp.]